MKKIIWYIFPALEKFDYSTICSDTREPTINYQNRL